MLECEPMLYVLIVKKARYILNIPDVVNRMIFCDVGIMLARFMCVQNLEHLLTKLNCSSMAE